MDTQSSSLPNVFLSVFIRNASQCFICRVKLTQLRKAVYLAQVARADRIHSQAVILRVAEERNVIPVNIAVFIADKFKLKLGAEPPPVLLRPA